MGHGLLQTQPGVPMDVGGCRPGSQFLIIEILTASSAPMMIDRPVAGDREKPAHGVTALGPVGRGLAPDEQEDILKKIFGQGSVAAAHLPQRVERAAGMAVVEDTKGLPITVADPLEDLGILEPVYILTFHVLSWNISHKG